MSITRIAGYLDAEKGLYHNLKSVDQWNRAQSTGVLYSAGRFIGTRVDSMFVATPLEALAVVKNALLSVARFFGCIAQGFVKVVRYIRPSEYINTLHDKCPSGKDFLGTVGKTAKLAVGTFSTLIVGTISPSTNIKIHQSLQLPPQRGDHSNHPHQQNPQHTLGSHLRDAISKYAPPLSSHVSSQVHPSTNTTTTTVSDSTQTQNPRTDGKNVHNRNNDTGAGIGLGNYDDDDSVVVHDGANMEFKFESNNEDDDAGSDYDGYDEGDEYEDVDANYINNQSLPSATPQVPADLSKEDAKPTGVVQSAKVRDEVLGQEIAVPNVISTIDTSVKPAQQETPIVVINTSPSKVVTTPLTNNTSPPRNLYQPNHSFSPQQAQFLGSQPYQSQPYASYGNSFNNQFAQPYNNQFAQPYNNQFGQPYNNQFGQPYNSQINQPYNSQFPISSAMGSQQLYPQRGGATFPTSLQNQSPEKK